jgi:hypothetical protein
MTLAQIAALASVLVSPLSASTLHLNAAVIPPLPGVACADLGVPSGACTGTPTALSQGTPVLADPTFNLFLDPGTVSLGIFVVPGDAVLFEHSGGSLTNPSSWSDVVHFANGPNGSTATTFADTETGPLLPPGFVLSTNAVSIIETQTGTGTDADFTVYNPGGGSVTYNVFSDAALTPEPVEPSEGVPEPSTFFLLAGGVLILTAGQRVRKFRGFV